MKNIFISGVARSGKSNLSKRLHDEYNYNHIPLDYFTSSLKKNFPQRDINSNVIMNESSEKLALLLSNVMKIINNTDEKFVIDSAHILPEDILRYIDRKKWDIYYIGYPNINEKEKLDIIRKYDTNYDWTYKRNDNELLDILRQLIDLSKKIQMQCDKNNIQFIDTSYNFYDNIEKGYKQIIKNSVEGI